MRASDALLAICAAAAIFGLVGGCGETHGSTEPPLSAGSSAVAGTSAGGASSAGAPNDAVAGSAGSSGAGGAHTGNAGQSSGGGQSVAGSAGSSGAAGQCRASSQLTPWPGKDQVTTLDQKAQFESDLSGLTYEPGAAGQPGVLWAVNNLSGTLFRLLRRVNGFVPDTANGWSAGKQLLYPNGQGSPDAEGVTFAASVAAGVYVCAEHDADAADVGRLSVLRYDVSNPASILTATHEWNLTALLPKVGANTGLEAITWLPDYFLTGLHFFDDTKQRLYNPADYPDHGDGLFFVGVEETGKIHVVALDHQDSSAQLLATIATPNAGVMGLEFDREAGNLWFNCDDTCGNKSGVLGIDVTPSSPTLGHFVVRAQFERPSSLPDSNNEGIAVAPQTECFEGFKSFFWTDDDDHDGFSLRTDQIPCGALCF